MLARASAAGLQTCSPAYAEEALARMKGCHVHIEGIDECVIAFLVTLSPAAVRDLVGEWHHDLGFPTVSRLIAGEPRPAAGEHERLPVEERRMIMHPRLPASHPRPAPGLQRLPRWTRAPPRIAPCTP